MNVLHWLGPLVSPPSRWTEPMWLRDVVVQAVRQVLQRQRDAGRAVVLEYRNSHELVDHPRDDHRQMGAEPAVVLAVVVGGGEAHVGENIGIVAGHVRVAARRAAGIVAVDVELGIVVAGAGGQPGHAPAVAADPQQAAQAELLRLGERVDLDDPADQVRLLGRGDRGRPARDRVADDDRRTAQVTDQREQVARDVGPADGIRCR